MTERDERASRERRSTRTRPIAERMRELEVANERLRELDRVKDEFVSDVTHELRTPLTNIKLYLSLLQTGRPERRERYVEVLVREADRLNALVEDLLDLSRVDIARARGQPDKSDVDLLDVVSCVVDGFAAMAQRQGVSTAVSAEEDLPPVHGDAGQLTRVVVNLVANAVNYSPGGGAVSVVLVREGPSVSMELTDTGMGISTAEIDRVFERFFRTDAARALGVEGTGLGLSIVKEIVEMHDGEVTVSSREGAGTRVTVLLPAADEAEGLG